jgi:hypothetical protein
MQGQPEHLYNRSLDQSIIGQKDVQIHNRSYHFFFSKTGPRLLNELGSWII